MVETVPDSIRETWKKGNAFGRIADPVEVSNVVLFLLSEKSSFITSTVSPQSLRDNFET